MFAAIEAGGTKFVCSLGDEEGPRETVVLPTGDVDGTLIAVERFFETAAASHGAPAALGLACFGPLELDRGSPDYGRITTTPKPGWRGADLPARLAAALRVPVAIDTDVNAAALAEASVCGVDRLAYVTVGTGIGVGLVIDGEPQHGRGHPEMGHIPVRRHQAHGGFPGVCPYHGGCLEGLAAGPAVQAAWGSSLATLPHDHAGWEVEADYLGQLCATLILTLAPERIVLGGGVMQQERLLPMVRAVTIAILGGYCAKWDDAQAVARITAPSSPIAPGLAGAYLLASRALFRGEHGRG